MAAHVPFVGRLFIKHCSLPSESTDQDGTIITVLTAVKQSPFTVKLGLDTSVVYCSQDPSLVAPPGSHPLPLTNVNLDATLLFDLEEEKEVDYVRQKPIESKVIINEHGTEATFEIKLKVLSSQLRSNFRIRFRAQDAIQALEISPHMTIVTNPIKILSKPEKTKKRTKATNKKPTNNDVILNTLEMISQRQQDHFKKLQAMLQDVGAPPTPISEIATPFTAVSPFHSSMEAPRDQFSLLSTFPPLLEDLLGEPPSKKQKIDDDRPLDFETAFKDMMKAFESLSVPSRSVQMENFVRENRISVEKLTELHDMLSSGGLDRSIGQSISRVSSTFMDVEQECNCTNCPFRLEVQETNSFISSFFLDAERDANAAPSSNSLPFL